MSYKFLEHTADLRLQVEAATYSGLLQEAVAGLFTYLKPTPAKTNKVQRRLMLSAPDKTALLIDFLNQVLFLAQSHKEMYDTIEFEICEERQIKCSLLGYPVKKFGRDIKAVTHHEAQVEYRPLLGWRAQLVFDI